MTLYFHFRFQLDVKDSEYGEVQRKSQLLAALKELYSCGQITAAAASMERESSETLPSIQDSQLDQPMQVNLCKYMYSHVT